MGANVTQPAINIRERLNELDTHNHDCDYVKRGEVVGKNLLINPDNSESQRDDYSTATTITSGKYYIDRQRVSLVTLSGEITHKALDSDYGVRFVRHELTSGGNGYIVTQERVENYQKLIGRTLTFAVEVRANHPVYVYINDGVNTTFSKAHSGSGEVEILKVTAKIASGADRVRVNISSYNGAIPTLSSGDYFEVGNRKLELGDKFTGFEVVDPAVNKARCHRYAYDVTEGMTASGDRIATGQCTSTTQAVIVIPLTNMRAVPDNPTFSTPSDFALTGPSGATIACTAITVQTKSNNNIALLCTVASGLTAGNTTTLKTNTTSAKLVVTAEL